MKVKKKNCKHLWIASRWQTNHGEPNSWTGVTNILCQKCLGDRPLYILTKDQE